MCGGSGPSGETKVNWNEDMAPRWNNLLNAGINNAFQVQPDGSYGVRPRASYTGERFAPIQYDQMAAGSNIRSLNDLSTGTIQASNAGRDSIIKTLGGSGMTANPYAGPGAAAANPYIGGNPNMTQNTSTERNLFAGANPYFADTMKTGMQEIGDVYRNATDPSLKAAAVLNGTLGGGDHVMQQEKNEQALGKNLSNFADSMLNQQYTRSAGLEDAFLGRDLQNQQFNKGQNSGLYESMLGRGFQNYNGGLDRGMQAYENERGRQMQAIGYGQNEQQMALDRAMAQMGVGSMYQQQGQKQNDFNFDQWNQQQNHPFTSMDWLAGLFGKSVGSGGMNTSMYQGGGNSAAPWLGAGLGLMSMFG